MSAPSKVLTQPWHLSWIGSRELALDHGDTEMLPRAGGWAAGPWELGRIGWQNHTSDGG